MIPISRKKILLQYKCLKEMEEFTIEPFLSKAFFVVSRTDNSKVWW